MGPSSRSKPAHPRAPPRLFLPRRRGPRPRRVLLAGAPQRGGYLPKCLAGPPPARPPRGRAAPRRGGGPGPGAARAAPGRRGLGGERPAPALPLPHTPAPPPFSGTLFPAPPAPPTRPFRPTPLPQTTADLLSPAALASAGVSAYRRARALSRLASVRWARSLPEQPRPSRLAASPREGSACAALHGHGLVVGGWTTFGIDSDVRALRTDPASGQALWVPARVRAAEGPTRAPARAPAPARLATPREMTGAAAHAPPPPPPPPARRR